VLRTKPPWRSRLSFDSPRRKPHPRNEVKELSDTISGLLHSQEIGLLAQYEGTACRSELWHDARGNGVIYVKALRLQTLSDQTLDVPSDDFHETKSLRLESGMRKDMAQ
jgi:hypothetical protein